MFQKLKINGKNWFLRDILVVIRKLSQKHLLKKSRREILVLLQTGHPRRCSAETKWPKVLRPLEDFWAIIQCAPPPITEDSSQSGWPSFLMANCFLSWLVVPRSRISESRQFDYLALVPSRVWPQWSISDSRWRRFTSWKLLLRQSCRLSS